MSDPIYFINKTTKNKVKVIKVIGRMVKVQYTNSGKTSWFFYMDLANMFNRIQ